MSEKKFNGLDIALQEITSSGIRFSPEDRKRYNEHLGKVLDRITEQMQKDEVFKCLHRNRVYTGSSYENLRISKPDEFDINLIFFLPAECKIVYGRIQPGFVKIKINSLYESQIKKLNKDAPSLEKILNSWIEKKNGYLLRPNFMQWMQGVFDKAMKEVNIPDTEIKKSASGPAFTIKVSQPKLGLSEYSVDLVPVFEFPDTDWPPAPVRKLPEGLNTKEWTCVPKPPPDVNDPAYWRMSFYKQERELMKNLHGMKHIIKLLKLFRDNQNWKPLSSYAIKTMFLWEHDKQSKGFWQNSIGKLFVHMLRRLSEFLNKQSIPFYWDIKLNLLAKIKEDTMKIMSNRITVVLNQIEVHLNDNPQLIKKFFCCATLEEVQSQQLSNTKCNFKESSCQESAIIKSNKAVISVAANKNTQIPPFELSKLGKSSVAFASISEALNKNSRSPQENVHVTVGKFGQSNTNPQSYIDILSIVLKEQREMKQNIQLLTQKYDEIQKEIRELREENMQIRKHLRTTRSAIPITKPLGTIHNLVDLTPMNSHECFYGFQLDTNQQNQSVLLNFKEDKIHSAVTNTKNSYLEDLADIFPAQ